MKQRIIVFLCVLAAFALAGCGSPSIEGTWTASMDGVTISVAFIGDHCFYLDNNNSLLKCNFTFENGTGSFSMGNTSYPFTVKGNTLTLNIGGINVPLTRDTRTTAPSAIAGVWAVPNTRWLIAFAGNMAYFVDRDGDETHGVYTFNNNSGSFRTDRYGYNVNFSVSGTVLTTEITGYYDGTYTFNRQ